MKKLAFLPLVLLGSAFAQGDISVDGSSTVYPITLAMAEEFQVVDPDTRVVVAFSGTGGGFERFCAGATQVSNASRVISEDEIALCEENGVEFIELPVAADALTVVVNPENDWVQCLTVEQLNQIWGPDSTVQTWADVNPEWPDEQIELYGAGTDSGTFDYFTEAVNGEGGAIRTDFFPSEDDNVLVQGVQGNTNAMGFFGFAYYNENPDSLKALEIDGGEGCVEPSAENIENNTYTPLSRPLFIYVNAEAADSVEGLDAFIDFYLDDANVELIEDTGYATYGEDIYAAVQARYDNRVTGSAFLDFEPGDSVLGAVNSATE
jgi:phosphate transport system substrate-binding protein